MIAPSIPGYGFSSAPQKTGFHLGHAARIFTSLMNRLGHQTFYTQGGDWGALITSVLATIYPSNVRGAHLNMATSETASANLKLLLSQLVILSLNSLCKSSIESNFLTHLCIYQKDLVFAQQIE